MGKIKTREVEFNREVRCDSCDIIQFIEDNSDYEWNDICDLTSKFELCGHEGRGAYQYYQEIDEYSKSEKDKDKIFVQDMINKFLEAYDLKEEGVTVEFTN